MARKVARTSKDGSVVVRWVEEIRRSLPTGEEYRAGCKKETKREAEEWLRQREAEVAEVWARHRLAERGCPIAAPAPPADVPASPDVVTLKEFADTHWWPHVEGRLSPSTLLGYRSHWKKIEAFFGAMPLTRIDGAAVDRFRREYKGSAPQNALVPLSSCLTLATKRKDPGDPLGCRRILPYNPLREEGFSRDRELPEPVHHTPEELERLLLAWPHEKYPREGLAVWLALKLAFRLGECRAVRPGDFHLFFRWGPAEGAYALGAARPTAFVRGWVELSTNRVRGPEGYVTKKPKSRKARKVPVPESLAWALLSFLDRDRPTLLADETGRSLDGSGSRAPLQRLLREVQTGLGMDVHTFHDLRNTCLETWLVNGVKPWNVSFWGAHAEGSHMARVTRNHYTGMPEIDWEDVPKMEAHRQKEQGAAVGERATAKPES